MGVSAQPPTPLQAALTFTERLDVEIITRATRRRLLNFYVLFTRLQSHSGECALSTHKCSFTVHIVHVL